jgi:hypothetical protein
MTPAERVEAVRPLEAESQAPSGIAWKLKADPKEISRICSFLRREREARGEQHPNQNSESAPGLGHVPADGPLAARGSDESAAPHPEAKASEDNGATVPALSYVPADCVAGEASRVDAGRTASATSEHGRDSRQRPAPDSPSDGGAIAAVKGRARLANAAGVEPPPSDKNTSRPPAYGGRDGRPSIPSPDAAGAKATVALPSPVGPASRPGTFAANPDVPSFLPPRVDQEPAMRVPVKRWEEMSPREKGDVVAVLINEGKRNCEICDELGINRNQIAGVVSRLKQQGRIRRVDTGSRAARSSSTKRVAAAKPRARKPSARTLEVTSWRGPNNPHHNNLKARAEQRAKSPGIIIRRENAFDPIPGTTPAAFGSAGCKFPVDGIHGPGLLWCGQPRDLTERADEPYCQAHAALAYTAPAVRQRASVGA